MVCGNELFYCKITVEPVKLHYSPHAGQKHTHKKTRGSLSQLFWGVGTAPLYLFRQHIV